MIGILTLLLLFISGPTFSDTSGIVIHSLRHFPAASPQVCREQAVRLGELYGKKSGANVLTAECLNSEPDLGQYKIVFQFAAFTIPFVSTVPPTETGFPHGFFKSQEECLDKKQSLESQFTLETNLPILASYCFKNPTASPYPWNLNMETLGTPLKAPYSAGLRIDIPISQTAHEKIRADLQEYLSELGGALALLAIRPNLIWNGLGVLAYSPIPIQFKSEYHHGIRGVEECNRKAQEIIEISKRERLGIQSSFCSSPFASPKFLDLFLITDRKHPSWPLSLERFGSYEECVSKIPELQKEYSALWNQEIFTGLCAIPWTDSDVYRIEWLTLT